MDVRAVVIAVVAGAGGSALAQQLPGHVRAVNAAAAAGGNGNSWASAFGTLQAGLDAAAASGGQVTELWLAQGEYSPTLTPGNCATVVLNGLSLYGGFVGTETSAGERPAGGRSTIVGSSACQYRHLLMRVETTSPVTLDAITLARGMHMLNFSGPGTLTDVTIDSQNWEALVAWGGPITMRRCRIETNWTALAVQPVRILAPGLIEDSTIRGAAFQGVGVQLSGLVVRNSVIGGSAEGHGLSISNSVFEDCELGGWGYSASVAVNGSVLRRCVIRGSNEHSGAILSAASTLFEDCDIEGTSPGSVGIVGGAVVRSRIRAEQTYEQHYAISFNDAPVWESVLETTGDVGFGGARRIVNTRIVGSGSIRTLQSATPHFINCLFQSVSRSAAQAPVLAQPGWRFTNCVFWPPQIGSTGVIGASAGMSGFINHSIVRGWTGQYGGVGNSGADPELNPDGTLMAGSPAIDAGDTSALPSFTTRDLAGNCRVVPGAAGGAAVVDIGPFEFGCYGNCDCSEAAPVLNVGDFTCFLQRFAAADAWANCDGSTTAPVLNVADFTCFLGRFAAGCAY